MAKILIDYDTVISKRFRMLSDNAIKTYCQICVLKEQGVKIGRFELSGRTGVPLKSTIEAINELQVNSFVGADFELLKPKRDYSVPKNKLQAAYERLSHNIGVRSRLMPSLSPEGLSEAILEVTGWKYDSPVAVLFYAAELVRRNNFGKFEHLFAAREV